MNHHYLKHGLLLFFLALISAIAIFTHVYLNSNSGQSGTYIFKNTNSQLAELSKISIKTPKSDIDFYKEDSLWRISEADGYYANYNYMQELINFFKNSQISRPLELSKTEAQQAFANSTTIATYDKDDKVINSIIVGEKTANKRFAYAKFSADSQIYLISNPMFFPEYIYSWLQQPLLSLNPVVVQDIIFIGKDGNTIIGRDAVDLPFWEMEGVKPIRPIFPEALLNQLQNIGFINVVSAQNFDESIFPENKEFQIRTFDGLIIELKIFKKGHQYWLKQILSKTSLPTSIVNDYIKEKAFLSNYWYFELTEHTGSHLFETNILN